MGKKKVKRGLDKTIHEICRQVNRNEIMQENRAETVKALASLVEARALLK